MINQNNAAQAAEQEIREGFELTYAADADDPACAADLFHFANGWRACIMSQVRAPVTDERAAFSRAEISFPMTIPGNRVYLAGPMTGHENHNFPAFHAAAERLRGSGLEVINPADHGLVNGLGWSDYMRWDLVKLAGCHSVYVLPGWEKSKGASLEVAIARALGMPVFTVDGASLASAPVASARAALAQLEAACDTLCRLRTQEQYLSMVDSGQQDALLALDDARAQARAALASAPVANVPLTHRCANCGAVFQGAGCPSCRLAAPVASAPVAGEAQHDTDSACAWQVWWNQNKSRFTTTRQASIAAFAAGKDWRNAAPLASAEDVRNAALDEAIQAISRITTSYATFTSGNPQYRPESRPASAAIAEAIDTLRALKTQADKGGGQQRAGDAFPDYMHDLRYHDQFRIGWNRCVDAYRSALSATQAGQGERDA
ncbi:DUF4406 domain-containing protein [Achromobacter xylosoxidans]|uniref:DUF4406 domain-containing protein n=1 Tax=Alcaligenes xylosoxydans xylosoxydans TaxID=85698 RepID=UPI0022B8E143|nr:DUF4406 domain-containing protein [Achromobacter xylosoxidans]MCZ8437153.1 DUF4406 domain-containing protein [Achromobacter xylosoxidans]